MNNKVTYRQQYTRCGKDRCRKCKEGAGHGPYWYAYWSENGRTVSKYIGIHLPADVEIEQQTAKNENNSESSLTTANSTTLHALPEPGSPTEANEEAGQTLPLALPTQVLRMYVLGQFRVERLQGTTWSPVVNRTWHRRRARALLGCLLSSPGRRLGREQAMEALWPDLDMETAANRLNGAVHELRQILEPEIARPAASRMLRLERDMLVLADRSIIWVDADAFESLLNEVHTSSLSGAGGYAATFTAEPLHTSMRAEASERYLEQTAALYGGDYLLEELYSEWAAPRREVLRRGWIGLLLKLAELREARGAYASAMEPLNRLLATDPTDETAVQRVMLLLTQLDRRGEALHTYRRLATRLQRHYESEPLPETRELYEKLRLGHIPKAGQAQSPAPRSENLPLAVSEKESSASTPNVLHEPELPETTDMIALSSQAHETLKYPGLLNAVSGGGGVNSWGRHSQSPLIGRTNELETMRSVLLAIEGNTSETSRNGNIRVHMLPEKKARVLLLMGEAGIGKTRLAEELSMEAQARGWTVAWTRAYEQEGGVPYRPWIELLRTLLHTIPPDVLHSQVRAGNDTTQSIHAVPTALERLSTLLPELRDLFPHHGKTVQHPPLPPEQERLHLWEATSGLLSMLSKTTPLLLVLDDLHWTDGSSRELLAYVTRHSVEQQMLLLGTCRDGELSPHSGLRSLIADLRREQAIVTLALHPLTQSQIGSLVAHLPQHIVQSIQTQAAGNPFFAEELARVSEAPVTAALSMKASPVPAAATADYSQPTTGSGLPESIAAVLERRLGRLSSDCQQLLGKAAVLGGAFEFGQLRSMAHEHSEDTLLDLLEEALRAGLLTEEGGGAQITYHFWHPLIVSHLYERLSAARVAQLHRRAANALLETHPGHEGEVAAAIVYHLSKGGGEAAQVALYAELAGNQAYTLAAFGEAEQYYLLAVKTLTDGLYPFQDAEDETLTRKSEDSLNSVRDPLHVARLLERVCECATVQGNNEEARRTYECILYLRNRQAAFLTEAERQREAQLQALIWREIGRTWAANGQFEQAYESYKRGEQAMRDAGVTSGAAWACILMAYGNIRTLQGNYDEARRFVLEALEMLQQLLDGRGAAEVEGSTEQQHMLPMGEPALRRFETRTEQAILGTPLEVGQAHESLGIVDANVGQFTESLKHLHQALAIYEQHDLAIAMVKVYGNLGAVHAVKSENMVAHTYMRRALELAERMGNLPIIAFVSGNLGEMATRSGHLREAETWFRRSLVMAEQINDPEQTCWGNVALAVALQDQGDLSGAAESIRRSLAIARAMKSTRNIGGALIALGDLRVLQASLACPVPSREKSFQLEAQRIGRRYLLRAKATIQRALVLEGLESELLVEGHLILASIYFLAGDLATAKQEAMQTMEEAREHELTRMLARSQRLLGRILAAQGNYVAADEFFEQALQVFRECELRLDYARALHGYGETLLERSEPEEESYQKGLAYLSEARTIFIDCSAAIDLAWVEAVLNTSRSASSVQ